MHAQLEVAPDGPLRTPREAVLLVNVRSRRGAALHAQVRRMLEERGVVVTAEHLVTDPAGMLPVLLPQILASRPPLLVVGSGDTDVPVAVDVDGEVSGTTPVHVSVSAQALRVLVPRDARRPDTWGTGGSQVGSRP